MAQPASVIAEMAGFSIPEGTTFFLVKETGCVVVVILREMLKVFTELPQSYYRLNMLLKWVSV